MMKMRRLRFLKQMILIRKINKERTEESEDDDSKKDVERH